MIRLCAGTTASAVELPTGTTWSNSQVGLNALGGFLLVTPNMSGTSTSAANVVPGCMYLQRATRADLVHLPHTTAATTPVVAAARAATSDPPILIRTHRALNVVRGSTSDTWMLIPPESTVKIAEQGNTVRAGMATVTATPVLQASTPNLKQVPAHPANPESMRQIRARETAAIGELLARKVITFPTKGIPKTIGNAERATSRPTSTPPIKRLRPMPKAAAPTQHARKARSTKQTRPPTRSSGLVVNAPTSLSPSLNSTAQTVDAAKTTA